MLSRGHLFATPWTVAYQALPSMGFSRQEYWSRLPFPSPGDLPNPEIDPRSPALADGFFTLAPHGKPFIPSYLCDSSGHMQFTLSLPSLPKTSLVAQMVKRLPTMRETQVQCLGREDLLEKEMATHSNSLA